MAANSDPMMASSSSYKITTNDSTAEVHGGRHEQDYKASPYIIQLRLTKYQANIKFILANQPQSSRASGKGATVTLTSRQTDASLVYRMRSEWQNTGIILAECLNKNLKWLKLDASNCK